MEFIVSLIMLMLSIVSALAGKELLAIYFLLVAILFVKYGEMSNE